MKRHLLRFVLTVIIYIAIKAAISFLGFEYVVTFLLACIGADVFIHEADYEEKKNESKKEDEHE